MSEVAFSSLPTVKDRSTQDEGRLHQVSPTASLNSYEEKNMREKTLIHALSVLLPIYTSAVPAAAVREAQ